MDPCTYKSVFNIDCPGCGLTRAFDSLMHGNVLESFQFHPSLIPLILTCGFLLSFILFRKNQLQKLTMIFLGVSVFAMAANFLESIF